MTDTVWYRSMNMTVKWCDVTHPTQVSTSGFVTEEKAVEVEEFFKKNPTPAAERIVRQNCEAIRLNAKWLERDSKAIEEWLKTQ